MECPYCRSRSFYLKNLEDEYETYEFDLKGGTIEFLEKGDPPLSLSLERDTQVFCNRCAWHGRMEDLKR